MNKRPIAIALTTLLLLNAVAGIQAQAPLPDWTTKTGARVTPPLVKRAFNVNDYGAKGDSTTLNTKFIQKAIDACAAKGGGIVSFNKGAYVTGALFLKKNVHLRIDK